MYEIKRDELALLDFWYLKNRRTRWPSGGLTTKRINSGIVQGPLKRCPKMGAMGYFSAEEFTKAAEELKVIKQAIVNGYALKTTIFVYLP